MRSLCVPYGRKHARCGFFREEGCIVVLQGVSRLGEEDKDGCKCSKMVRPSQGPEEQQERKEV